MKKATLSLLGVLLTVCFIIPNCFAQGIPGAKSANNVNPQAQTKTIFSFKSELGLTDDQEVKLKALLYDEQSFIDANNATLKTLGTALGKMIKDKADMQGIKNKLEEISQIQVKVSYRNIEDSRKVEMILSPDQLAKWKDIQKNFSSESKQ